MSHKKAGGSTTLGRDSVAKRLGVKLYAGQKAKVGDIIIRQRGSKFRAGVNVKKGGDDTLFATAVGLVKFSSRKIRSFDGKLKLRNFVSVINNAK
ncbi:50S ribosomal protein L27 [Candidatus Falkowbacteria bacterium]|nr:50S ribosomal protein L27 [Candidatus Falkowbacteria bacterium]